LCTGSSKSEGSNEFLTAIAQAKKAKPQVSEYSYAEKDVILYSEIIATPESMLMSADLGVGAKREDLSLVYENNDNFQPLPSFGVIPQFNAVPPYSMGDILPNFNPMMLVHGEHFLEVRQHPIPTSGKLSTTVQLLDVVDKGKSGIIVQAATTKDERGNDLFYNETTVFVRGAGGFGGPRQPKDRGAGTAANTPPKRAPDAVAEEPTFAEQAALYRLSGDYNPLHIDPDFSAVGGFKTPILHGLCFFGIAVKHVVREFGAVKNVKVRFAGPVIPGQTLRTEMWKEGNKILFAMIVKDTGKPCIAGGGAELLDGGKTRL
jgi:multifunctional beta-oxidation protein